jgi:hypothetical protein
MKSALSNHSGDESSRVAKMMSHQGRKRYKTYAFLDTRPRNDK